MEEGAIQSGEWQLFQYVFTCTKDPMKDKILVDKYKSEEYVTPAYNIQQPPSSFSYLKEVKEISLWHIVEKKSVFYKTF